MNLEKIKDFLEKNGQPKFRLKQIQKAVYGDGVSDFAEISTLPKELKRRMSKLSISSFEVEKVLVAKPARNATHSIAGGDKQSAKALLKLHDGKIIETVLISPKPARLASTNGSLRESRRGIWSVCVSCQVGCPMNCRFCATGKMGFERNLTAEEITDQILFWRQYIKKNNLKFNPEYSGQNSKIGNWDLKLGNYDVSNIVYMGMGEPFLNWENVRESLKNLINPELFGFGSRSISVSTAGIPDGIAKLAEEFPQVNLAVSLHFADDKKRSEFMPINKKYNLEDLKKALQNYFQKTSRKVFLEYILLKNINDTKEDADKLAKYLKSIGKLQLLHVNLIRYNATGEELKPSSEDKAREFKNFLIKNRIQATIRKSLGEEIQGACGQLTSH